MAETRKFLCVSCPVGCALTVALNGSEVVSVEGNQCKRGLEYASAEVTNPLRTFTSTVRVRGGSLPVCPVRSKTPLPLSKVFLVTRVLAEITAEAPIEIGQILIENVCDTGTDIIASRSLK
jgi:CxxC motif-containing protein